MAKLQSQNSSICLIKPELKHARAIATIENSPLVWRYSSLGQAPYTIEEIEQFITASNSLLCDGQVRFLIELNGDIIGCVDLYDYDEVERSAFVGIVVYPFSLHGKGYGTAAINILLGMLPELGITKLKAQIDLRNNASIAFFSRWNSGSLTTLIK